MKSMARAAGRRFGANTAGPTTTKAFERISSQLWKRAAQMAIVCCPLADRDSDGRKLARSVARIQGADADLQESQEMDAQSSTFSDTDGDGSGDEQPSDCDSNAPQFDECTPLSLCPRCGGRECTCGPMYLLPPGNEFFPFDAGEALDYRPMEVQRWGGSASSQLPSAPDAGREEEEGNPFSQSLAQGFPADPRVEVGDQGNTHGVVRDCNHGACAATLPPGPLRYLSLAGEAAPHLAMDPAAAAQVERGEPPQLTGGMSSVASGGARARPTASEGRLPATPQVLFQERRKVVSFESGTQGAAGASPDLVAPQRARVDELVPTEVTTGFGQCPSGQDAQLPLAAPGRPIEAGALQAGSAWPAASAPRRTIAGAVQASTRPAQGTQLSPAAPDPVPNCQFGDRPGEAPERGIRGDACAVGSQSGEGALA